MTAVTEPSRSRVSPITRTRLLKNLFNPASPSQFLQPRIDLFVHLLGDLVFANRLHDFLQRRKPLPSSPHLRCVNLLVVLLQFVVRNTNELLESLYHELTPA